MSPLPPAAPDLVAGDLLQVTVELMTDATLVWVAGEVDALTAPQLARTVETQLDASAGALDLDLQDVEFFSGAGTAVLVEAARLARKQDVALRIVVSAPVARVLDSGAGAEIAALGGVVVEQGAAAPSVPAPRTAESGRGASGYEHLAELFAERAALPPDHPRSRALRAELITGYLPVAQHIARKHGHRGENLDDLEQVATLGLILAVDRFEPERGFDFLSFAVPTINGEVLRHFRDRAWSIRVPRRLRELQSSIYDTAAELGQRLGRAARPSEIAEALGLELEAVLEGLQAQHAAHTFSLDEPTWDDDSGSGDRTRFSASLGCLDHELDLVESREALGPLLAELPERERRILLLRFFGGMTQTEIAQRVGISQMHVSRLLSSTLARLRRKLTG